MDSDIHSFYPITWWELSVKKEGTNGIIDGTDHPFGFPVLLGGMRTRVSESNAMRINIVLKLTIFEFSSIVALKRFYLGVQLIFDIKAKMKKF